MDNTNHRYTQRRPALRRRIACVLCWILLFQGYPLLALRESGGGFYLRDLSAVIDGDLLDWELPELPDVRWPADEDSGAEVAGSPSSTEPEEPHQVAHMGDGLLARVMSHLGWGYFGVPQASARPQTPPSPPRRRDQEAQTPPFDPEKGAKVFESPLDGTSLVPGWNLVSLPEEPADTDPATILNAIGGAYDAVYTYDACDATDPWKVYDPDDAAGSDLTLIDQRMGLWLDASLPVELPWEGTLPATTTLQLCTGWNLIGFPAAQPRHVLNALAPIAGKFTLVFGFDPADPQDPWEIYDVNAPPWANDLQVMQPGRGYWVLLNEDTTLELANQGTAPEVSITIPEDLVVITQPTAVIGTIRSSILDSWTLSYRLIGDTDWIELASQPYPMESTELATFDPTLLLNGLHEIRLQATDIAGQESQESVAVSVEGQMKIGQFTLAFTDLAVPVSGLDIKVIRTYDSRDKRQGDFGVGWTLGIRQGSYQNNRTPGDGWKFHTGFLPCDTIVESKSHVTTIRLSDQEIYRFALQLSDGAPTLGGCFAQAWFAYVDGPLPGSTLAILGSTEVFFANGSDRVVEPSTQEPYVPRNVRLTTRDGRVFHLNLENGVTHIEDLKGNALEISPSGITHSSGRGVEFVRDAAGRIGKIIDPEGHENLYAYDALGDLASMTDRVGAVTRFTYEGDHYLADVVNAFGVRAVRTEYDDAGRMIRLTDASGKTAEFAHDLDARREVVTNRLGFTRILEYDARGNVVHEADELGEATLRTFDAHDNLLSQTDPLGRTTTFEYTAANELRKITDADGHATEFSYDDRGQVLTVKDPLGHLTTNEYDALGNRISTTDALSHGTELTYYANGNLESVTDPLGSVTRFEYDTYGNLTGEEDPLGHVRTFTYDRNGNRLSETETRTFPDGSTETLSVGFTYDAVGRPTRVTAADGTQIRTTYDLVGRERSWTDEAGRVTQLLYDLSDRLVGTILSDGTVVTGSLGLVGMGLETADGWLEQATRNAMYQNHNNVPTGHYHRGCT